MSGRLPSAPASDACVVCGGSAHGSSGPRLPPLSFHGLCGPAPAAPLRAVRLRLLRRCGLTRRACASGARWRLASRRRSTPSIRCFPAAPARRCCGPRRRSPCGPCAHSPRSRHRHHRSGPCRFRAGSGLPSCPTVAGGSGQVRIFARTCSAACSRETAAAVEAAPPTMAEAWAATARADLGLRHEGFFVQMPDDLIGAQWGERQGASRVHNDDLGAWQCCGHVLAALRDAGGRSPAVLDRTGRSASLGPPPRFSG